MQKSAKLFGAMFAGFSAMAFVCAAFAADPSPRAAANVRDVNRSSTSVARMPSMPIMTINPANLTTDTAKPSEEPQPEPKPEPKPDPKPEPDPDPDPKPEPKPEPECPDGGVRNSEYTVNNCMSDVLACINNGALSGGLNDLFNEDMRNSIMNGMGLCSMQVEKCMVSVRRDCKPVYRAIADVWVDFNSRIIQPEYYNFVLRKTGLTPNQAENTCLLLDVNTYGPSFAAVANNGTTTAEYNNRVGAYNNQQGGVLIKNNPRGVELNYGNPGVDGERGHYARWDASTATCYLRVAAYNKDKQIKNSWLFGAVGNDEPAEVWRAAGDTFSCNKDLFGFGLMNNTKTAAVVGVGGGTLAGAGIGALAGHGKRAFDCDNASALKTLNEQLNDIKDSPNKYLLNAYLDTEIRPTNLTTRQCKDLIDLYTDYETIKEGQPGCWGELHTSCDRLIITANPNNLDKKQLIQACDNMQYRTTEKCVDFLVTTFPGLEIDKENSKCEELKLGCSVQSLRNADSLYSYLKCDDLDTGICASEKQTKDQLAELEKFFNKLPILQGEEQNYSTTIPVGAAIGAGTGGLATAITAFVEKNNINCRVGDGLNTVAYGKSHSIDSLKDFYVKWNLRLPDTVIPTATAVDCKTWKLSCAEYTDLNQCKAAAINYKPALDGTITLVRSACAVSGSVCIENATVAKSYGACE